MLNLLNLVILAIALLIIIFALTVLLTYNSLIRNRNRVRTKFSDIQVQLHRRASLIQNLVDMVREYSQHENQTFIQVAAARNAVISSKTPSDSAHADNMLTSTLRSLFMVTEAYPKLLASENFQLLRIDIKETENTIAGYREQFNSIVESYNNTVQTFPTVFFAPFLGFHPEGLFNPIENEKFKLD